MFVCFSIFFFLFFYKTSLDSFLNNLCRSEKNRFWNIPNFSMLYISKSIEDSCVFLQTVLVLVQQQPELSCLCCWITCMDEEHILNFLWLPVLLCLQSVHPHSFAICHKNMHLKFESVKAFFFFFLQQCYIDRFIFYYWQRCQYLKKP